MAITDIVISGKLYSDAGGAIAGATVQLLETGTTTEEAEYDAGTGTGAAGQWTFTETSLDATYDVKITSGTSVRHILWSDEIALKGVDTASLKVRGVNGANAPIYLFADRADAAGDAWRIQATPTSTGTLAIGNDKASAGTIIDYVTITNGANAAASVVALGGDLTVGDDLSLTSDSAVFNMGAGNDFTITHDGTTGATIAGNPLTLDSGADIVLDAEGADVILKDGGTQYGSLTNSSSNLLIKSGSTTAATFSGANVTFAGTVDATTDFTVGSTVITDDSIVMTPSASDTVTIAGATHGILNVTTVDAAGTAADVNIDADGEIVIDAADAAGIIFKVNGSEEASITASGITLPANSDLTFSGTTGTNDIVLANGLADALSITDGSADVIVIDTNTSGNLVNFTAGGIFSGIIDVGDTTNSTDASGDTGSLRTAGGSSIRLKLFVGSDLDVGGTSHLDAVDIDGAVQIDATFTSGVDGQGYDTKFFGDTSGAFMLWDTSVDDLVLGGAAGIDLAGDIDVDGTANLDAVDIDGTLAVDGTTISLDATTSLNIDNSNTSNGITIATATSGVPISIGHATSETTVNDNLNVTGTSVLATVDINAGAIDGTVIGANSAAAGTFAAIAGTTGTFSGVVDITDATDSSDDSGDTGALRTEGGASIAKKLYVGTDLDVNGTANLDTVDIEGNTQADGTLTVGVDDTGYDVKFFGATTGAYMLWDESEDKLSLDQGGTDTDILELRSSDVTHGLTGQRETDVYAGFAKLSPTKGGLELRTFCQDDAGTTFNLDSMGGTASTTQSVSNQGLVNFNVRQRNGTGLGDVADGGNVFSVKAQSPSDSLKTKFMIDEDGDLHAVNSTVAAFDEYDDAQLIRVLDHSKETLGIKGMVKDRWDDYIKYNEQDLVDAGVLGDTIENGGLLNVTGLQRLHNGAIWQGYVRQQEMQERMEILENKLLAIEGGK